MCCILTFHWTLFQSLAHTVKGFHKEGLTYISNLFHVKHCKYNLKGRASCLNQPASRSHFYGGPQRTCHIFFLSSGKSKYCTIMETITWSIENYCTINGKLVGSYVTSCHTSSFHGPQCLEEVCFEVYSLLYFREKIIE